MGGIYSHNDMIKEIFAKIYIMCNFENGEYIDHDERAVYQFGSILRTLIRVDKYLNEKLTNKELIKVIISMIKGHRKRLDTGEIINILHTGVCMKLKAKIDNLFEIVFSPEKIFTNKDLSDPWLLNVKLMFDEDYISRKIAVYKEPKSREGLRQLAIRYCSHSLLTIAFKTKNLTKIEQLLEAGIEVDLSLLTDIAIKRTRNSNIYYLVVAQLFLDKVKSNKLTYPLMIAVKNDDELYAFLLLKYKVDPYITINVERELEQPFFWIRETEKRNVIDIANGKKWFLDLLEEMKI